MEPICHFRSSTLQMDNKAGYFGWLILVSRPIESLSWIQLQQNAFFDILTIWTSFPSVPAAFLQWELHSHAFPLEMTSHRYTIQFLTCVSHTAHVIYAGTVSKRLNPIVKLSSLPDSSIIIVFWGPNFSQKFQLEHPNLGVKCKG